LPKNSTAGQGESQKSNACYFSSIAGATGIPEILLATT
jgi:hypothetical protein